MTIPLIYGFIFGISGFILGCFFIFLAVSGFGYLFNFVFGAGDWPGWSRMFVLIAYLGSFSCAVLIQTFLIRKGIEFGQQKSLNDGSPKAGKTDWIFAAASLVVMALFVHYIVTNIIMSKPLKDQEQIAFEEREKTLVDRNQDSGLTVKQGDNKLNVMYTVYKRSPLPHLLTLRVYTGENLENLIKEISNEINLDFEKQGFNFEILFAELVKNFQNDYSSLIASQSESFKAAGGVRITATLEMLPLDENQEPLREQRILDSELSVRGKIIYECSNKQCGIVDFGRKQRFDKGVAAPIKTNGK